MTQLKRFLITLPIHLLTGGFSLLLYLVYLRFLDHLFSVTIVSFSLFALNIMSYILYSFLILRRYSWTSVLGSTSLFLGVGLLLWQISFHSANDLLDSLFWLYHTVGYTSFIWYDELFIPPSLESFRHYGYLFSIIPSCLILLGFGVGAFLKKRLNR